MDGTRAAAMLREDEWERTFDAVPDLITILDVKHRVLRVNRALAERLGRRPEDLVGQTCHELIHGAAAPPACCPHASLLRDGQQRAFEIHDERLGGVFLVSVSPLRDPQGALVGSVHVARDITGQKLAEAEARQAVTQRETFLAMLSHELRNPLGAILNASYVARRAPAREGAFQEALAVIDRQAAQMASLLDDLLDVSRVMQGKIELRCETLDVAEVVQGAVHATRPLCAERRQALAAAVDGEALMVRGDATRLRQVFANLLTNAAKYTPPGGRIEVSARRDGPEVAVRVRDNGRGIPREKLESIFDLFAQADEAADRRKGGMGVGLTLVRMIVVKHGGSVSAHSEGVGRGSEFLVRLPLVPAEPNGEVVAPAIDAATAAARILIVEDNPDSRSMLQALLELDGHDVRVAADGLQGLQTLTDGEFDLALIDIGLPGLDGYELARRFRSLRRKPSPRLIALTGYGRPADRQAVLAAGFDEHLVKPCDRRDLERVLQCSR